MAEEAPDLRAELEAAVEAARRGGAVLQRYAAQFNEQGVRYGWKQSSPASQFSYEVVSEADVEVDQAIQETLLGAFPDDGWLSEEAADTPARLRKRRVWIVDPLDGTREFLQGVPEYAVSIALAVNGEARVGVVYNPAEDELHAAAVPPPAAEAGELGTLDPAQRLADSFMLVGRGEWRTGDLPPVPRGTQVLPVGSIAYRLALLASGTGCLVFTVGRRSEWDIAAGAALLTARGATVTTLEGRPLTFNQAQPTIAGLIAANPTIHQEARTLWQQSGWRLS